MLDASPSGIPRKTRTLSKPVVTRFAPSPTGSLHIGGARTALFNALYAKHTGGKMLLRIEDTDRERSTQENVQIVLDGLSWLGVTWDEEPLLQHTRADRHREVAMELLKRGRAYRCWMSPEEVEAERAVARAEGRSVRSPWRDREGEGMISDPHVIRFKAPREGATILADVVKGDISFDNNQLDDLILLRSDGAPTYNLAVVVDDHDMGVTHIIRGDDHVSNGARQSLIYQAMDWDIPVFAHIPLIHGPDGAKLSKRHGAQAVGEFADMGYLPEAMRNYLARLGWGHGDDELFSDDQAAEWFDIKDVVSSPARLDWDKLKFINRHYIKLADDARLVELLNIADVAKARAMAAVPLVKEGASTLVELRDLIAFTLKHTDDMLDAKTLGLVADADTHGRLSRLKEQIAVTEWNAPALEQAIRDFAASEQIGIGKFGPALRGLMGKGAPAPDLASTLMALGRDEALARWDYGLRA